MLYNAEIAGKVAEYLLQIKAIKIQPSQPFTWASGWKSPIYCDNRVTLSYPDIRAFIKESFCSLIRDRFSNAELIAGVATAGIAQGILVAEGLKLPFVYVRPEAKKHGRGRQVEGEVQPGQKTVVMEDLISTGKSALAVLQPLRNEGCKILGVAATFDYGFETAVENFKKNDCRLYSLSDYEHLLRVALRLEYIQPHELETLRAWRLKPEKWGETV
ncbi:MAG TPA: orotate phosphoribosyltransferase [Chitinophagales bacterium]|nr:orotate phosphoribosyltransferase [Chitinophagales bacterium]